MPSVVADLRAPHPPDPRPRLSVQDGCHAVDGMQCQSCAYAVAFRRPRCPVCGGPMVPRRFGPSGTVWASTVLHVPVPGRDAPFGLAYVDLDAGPRVLAHVRQHGAWGPVPVGGRVRLMGATEAGDLEVDVE